MNNRGKGEEREGEVIIWILPFSGGGNTFVCQDFFFFCEVEDEKEVRGMNADVLCRRVEDSGTLAIPNPPDTLTPLWIQSVLIENPALFQR